MDRFFHLGDPVKTALEESCLSQVQGLKNHPELPVLVHVVPRDPKAPTLERPKRSLAVHPGRSIRSISPGGSPKKGLIRLIRIFPPNCSLKCRVLKLRFLAFLGGPGGFRELREAGRNHFHLSWYLSVPVIVSNRIFLMFFLFVRDIVPYVFLSKPARYPRK